MKEISQFEGNDLAELCLKCFDTKGQHTSAFTIMTARSKTEKCDMCSCENFVPSGKRLRYTYNKKSWVPKYFQFNFIICPFCNNKFETSEEFDSHKAIHKEII